MGACKECRAKQYQKWKEKNKDALRIYQRKWRKKNKKRLDEYMQQYKQEHSKEIKARNTANNHIVDIQPCELCGNPLAIKHHNDYSKPLEIRFLCRRCHWKLHNEKKEEVYV